MWRLQRLTRIKLRDTKHESEIKGVSRLRAWRENRVFYFFALSKRRYMLTAIIDRQQSIWYYVARSATFFARRFENA